MRPGMYIGKLGDGTAPDDGIYILVKEVIDNCIDEYVMGFGKQIEIQVESEEVSIRDFGRGIPLGKVVDCVSKINTGGKYDSKAFKKSGTSLSSDLSPPPITLPARALASANKELLSLNELRYACVIISEHALLAEYGS